MSCGEILLFGDINIDTVWPVSEFPIPGRDAYAKTVSVGIGGAVVNTAIVLDRLGQPSGLMGSVGEDIWAQKIAGTLGKTGINQAYIRAKPDCSTGLIFLIITPDGERTMYSCRGANTQYEPADVDEAAFKNAGLLHISGYALVESPQREAAWRAVELAEKHRIPISLDTGLDPTLHNPADLRRILPKLAICITGLKETGALFQLSDHEAAAAHLLDLGVKLAAIKLGEKGSYVADAHEKYYCPPFAVRALDTTGAGDSYTAGLLYGWAKALSLRAQTMLGNALGALAASVYGAGTALPGKQQLLDLLKKADGDLATAHERKGLTEVVSFLEAAQ